jgi:sodium borate transporter 11
MINENLFFRITDVRETRLAALLAHVLIGISAICMLPSPLHYIPRSVLDGLFLYMAVTSVNGNEMVERILLLVTEQVRCAIAIRTSP